MLCYKDVTFCGFTDCGKFLECPRALTAQVQDDAERWWVKGGGNADDTPIAQYADMPGCHPKKFALG